MGPIWAILGGGGAIIWGHLCVGQLVCLSLDPNNPEMWMDLTCGVLEVMTGNTSFASKGGTEGDYL